MVSRKLRNRKNKKTRKRGGGGCGAFGCLPNAKSSAVVEPTPINARTKLAIRNTGNLMKATASTIVENKDNKKLQRALERQAKKAASNALKQAKKDEYAAETALIKKQLEDNADAYADHMVSMKSSMSRDYYRSYFIKTINDRLNNNILHSLRPSDGMNHLFPEWPEYKPGWPEPDYSKVFGSNSG